MITGLKKVKQIAEDIKNAELLGQIAELMLEAAELKGRIVDLENDNRTLRQQQDLRDKLEWRGFAYFATEAFTDHGPSPFCPVCMNRDGFLSPLQDYGNGIHICNVCDKRLLDIPRG